MRALEIITCHVIYNPAYTYKFQLKTTHVWDFFLPLCILSDVSAATKLHVLCVDLGPVWANREGTAEKIVRT